MLRVLFDFVLDRSLSPLGAGISDSPSSQKNAKERGIHSVGNARKINARATRPEHGRLTDLDSSRLAAYRAGSLARRCSSCSITLFRSG
jgi:hypothetical protein